MLHIPHRHSAPIGFESPNYKTCITHLEEAFQKIWVIDSISRLVQIRKAHLPRFPWILTCFCRHAPSQFQGGQRDNGTSCEGVYAGVRVRVCSHAPGGRFARSGGLVNAVVRVWCVCFRSCACVSGRGGGEFTTQTS